MQQFIRPVLVAVTALGIAGALAGPSAAAPIGPHDTPVISISGRACPSQLVQVSGTGFVNGSYTIQASAGALTTSRGHAVNGVLQPIQLRLPANPPASITVSAIDTSTDTDVAVASNAVALASSVTDRGSRMLLWQEPVTADCFAPGERVSVQVATTPTPATAAVTGPATVTATAAGKLNANFLLRPAGQSTSTTVTFTGQTSGQSTSVDLFQLPGTTLLAGQTLTDNGPEPGELMTPLTGYEMLLANGALQISHMQPNGDGAVVFDAGGDPANAYGSSLSMQTDGNLVIRSGAGKVLWTSGTAGTGSNNRLVLQSDGNLVMRTAAGTAIWSSVTGIVGGPNNLHTTAYVASSRPDKFLLRNGQVIRTAGAAVYINGLVKQATMTPTLVRGASRLVYLQRYLNGKWQNMLSRTTNSIGQMAVGFIQTKVYEYRLLVAHSATGGATASGITIR